ncbi:MAG TPA: hypothetical protein VFE63_07295 [Roseiarcus sp.]|nr:hypothetical protein [Roseiarcus sp.]
MSCSDLHLPVERGRMSSDRREVLPAVRAGFTRAIANQTGRSFPRRGMVFPEGVNFSVYSRQVGRVERFLRDDGAARQPARVIDPDPHTIVACRYDLLSASRLTAIGNEDNRVRPAIQRWNETRQVE